MLTLNPNMLYNSNRKIAKMKGKRTHAWFFVERRKIGEQGKTNFLRACTLLDLNEAFKFGNNCRILYAHYLVVFIIQNVYTWYAIVRSGHSLPCTTNYKYVTCATHPIQAVIETVWLFLLLLLYLLIIIMNWPFMCMFSEIWQQSRYNTLTMHCC